MFKVMIVDDESIMHKILVDFIEKFYPELEIVEHCYTGREALDKLAISAVDIVITDIKMPEMDGIELIKRIHELYPECIILMLSAYGEFEYARAAMDAGVFKYLLKPIDFGVLSDTLSLIIKKLKQMSLHTSNEEQLLFELIFGTIESRGQLNEELLECGKSDEFACNKGALYKFSILPCKSLNEWKYGLEAIDNMIVNIVSFFMNGGLVYIVARKNLIFYVVTLTEKNENSNLDINMLTEYICTETGFNCSIEIIDEFDSLYELIDNEKSAIEEFDNVSGIVKTAINYINQNYKKDISRNDIADMVHISPEYFSHCFKKETGYTFLQYLTKVRMNKAVELIDAGMKISDVITQVGYISRNRFYANFKSYTSYTPSEYRRNK